MKMTFIGEEIWFFEEYFFSAENLNTENHSRRVQLARDLAEARFSKKNPFETDVHTQDVEEIARVFSSLADLFESPAWDPHYTGHFDVWALDLTKLGPGHLESRGLQIEAELEAWREKVRREAGLRVPPPWYRGK